MAVSFQGAHFPTEIILMGVRWYVAYPLSTRHVEELMAERGVEVDHSTVNRWVTKYSPQLEEAFHHRKRLVWVSWRMDETFYGAVFVKLFLLCFGPFLLLLSLQAAS
jgi:transposase-like protein